MTNALSPIVSEFDTVEQEQRYDAWLKAKVAASLADPRPPVAHDEVERRMAERLARLKNQYAKAQ
ncbi:stability determinant [Ottowia sp.]|uniref:type II toxin-antitoxin system RelB family antitoxin n=1 Tax=Ottowia sp. TaxID=1898956 RepID=UPI0039E52581